MIDLPSADTIVQDIELELLLGSAPAGEVGQALAAIRREQNRLRSEYAAPRRRVEGREVAGSLLRLNDLILDLLQEVLSRLASVESVIDRAVGRASDLSRDDEAQSRQVVHVEPAEPPGALDLWPGVDLDVQPIPLPVVGRLVDRFRIALHRVALYYVHRMAEQQGAVNVYQARELEHLKSLVSEQRRRLAALEAEVDRLRAPASTDETEPGVGRQDG